MSVEPEYRYAEPGGVRLRYVDTRRPNSRASLLYINGVGLGIEAARPLLDAKGAGLQMLAGMGWTSASWLHRLEPPVLVLAGNEDDLVPGLNARFLAGRIPRARLEIIDGAGHMFPMSHPRETAQRVAAFLDAT